MKVKVLSLLVPALLVAGAANAAEVYNKDGNKLDLYGKVDGLHYFSDNKSEDGDQTYMRLGFKGETQVTDQLTGYGPVGISDPGQRSGKRKQLLDPCGICWSEIPGHRFFRLRS
ncbi:outer membrane porin protein C [Escherichia coli]|uniref:Outer membrane porin protein C n=1 Tax=Escherichia coli TaxID=562 RepID=A0A376W780_ECOLX|nr:outer membrane porin protein C [Escherichia coli]